MIQQLNRYGPLDKPEQQKQVNTNVNPLELVNSIYQVWLPTIKRALANIYPDNILTPYRYHSNIRDPLYKEAETLLKPYTDVISKINSSGLENLARNLEHTPYSGLFFSAVFNLSELKKIEGSLGHGFLGYRLPPRKKFDYKGGHH